MKVEVVSTVRYYANGFTLSTHAPSDVVDIPNDIAKGFIKRGACVPFLNRETKPLKAQDIEVKSNSRPSTRARKPSGAKSKPKDNTCK